MANVKFWCNSGANIHSCKTSQVIDTDTLGYDDGEWESMTEDEKYKEAEQWAWNNGLEIGFEEV